jgi:hypothetical protein
MGFFATAIDLVLAAGLVVMASAGVVFMALLGIFVKVLPFLIKLSAISVVVYAFLKMFGVI